MAAITVSSSMVLIPFLYIENLNASSRQEFKSFVVNKNINMTKKNSFVARILSLLIAVDYFDFLNLGELNLYI